MDYVLALYWGFIGIKGTKMETAEIIVGVFTGPKP